MIERFDATLDTAKVMAYKSYSKEMRDNLLELISAVELLSDIVVKLAEENKNEK